uniref:DNA-directed RNA polymerase II subunit RPB1 n=1 Tax=Lygus hesperus TaxID=30085 RepID=A0A0A9XRA4_LYGHE
MRTAWHDCRLIVYLPTIRTSSTFYTTSFSYSPTTCCDSISPTVHTTPPTSLYRSMCVCTCSGFFYPYYRMLIIVFSYISSFSPPLPPYSRLPPTSSFFSLSSSPLLVLPSCVSVNLPPCPLVPTAPLLLLSVVWSG